ncbi:hypothetical protein GGR50DRAFT_648225 [Xylaria sp. CBS 124048]|nr:hypothetical protein GGR50DRAFT_648225 [Xylaria sp. CBS 124048]
MAKVTAAAVAAVTGAATDATTPPINDLGPRPRPQPYEEKQRKNTSLIAGLDSILRSPADPPFTFPRGTHCRPGRMRVLMLVLMLVLVLVPLPPVMTTEKVRTATVTVTTTTTRGEQATVAAAAYSRQQNNALGRACVSRWFTNEGEKYPREDALSATPEQHGHDNINSNLHYPARRCRSKPKSIPQFRQCTHPSPHWLARMHLLDIAGLAARYPRARGDGILLH